MLCILNINIILKKHPTGGLVYILQKNYNIKAEHISFRYTDKSPWILNDISLEFQEGERAAIVGPSGYGKSTLAKILAGYEQASSGQVLLDGKPFPDKGFCPVQMFYQHPELAVNPRWKMEKILNECWNPDEELLQRMGIENYRQ